MFNIFVLLAPYVCFHIFSKVKVTDWPPIGKKAAHSAYEMFSWYTYLIISLVFFPPWGFGVGSFCWLRLFLIFDYLYLFLAVCGHILYIYSSQIIVV